MFTHLHVHSHYSFLDGPSSPLALAEQARALGYSALALTDTNGLYGAIAFLSAAKELGIKPIFGAELTASLPARSKETTALVLAKDQAGFAELCQLITARQLDPNFDLPQRLGKASLHVAILTPDLKFAQQVSTRRKGRGVYLELADASERGEPGKLMLATQIAGRANLPVIATHAVHFARPEEHAAHRALRAMHHLTSLHALPKHLAAPGGAYLRPPGEMIARFQKVPASLERAEALAEECNASPITGARYFPVYACPKGQTEFSYLSRLCFQGLRRRYRPVTSPALERLTRELAVIEQKHFAGYFLVVWDIAAEARRRKIPTVGRGSAANSIVSYCLGITHVDPLAHGLFFERFLNPEREDPPDIDLDFPWDQRDEMLTYAFQRFDPAHVAMICTVQRMHGRGAVREAGKVLGYSDAELTELARGIPHYGSVADISAAQAQVPETRHLKLKQEPLKSILRLAEQLEGVPRHLSVHPGGIVIVPERVEDVVPKEMSTKGLEVTQYDMYAAEDAGFIKIDLLGQRGLAVIRDTARAVSLNWSQVDPYHDPATKQLLREGQSMGCFYVESPAMRLLLRKLQCDDFELLVAASSIIRPGVSNSGMMRMFVERHLGRQAVRFAHPCLKPILQDTYGVMVYQEDVIKVAHAAAGMSLGEADKLRRCMSKKRHWEKMETYQKRFMQGAAENQIPEHAAQEIWRQIESFGGYAFCKAHSASYAQLSFQSAYLKAHHPAEFMAAVLSNQGGFYSAAAYLEEARRMQLKILGPDVNASQWRYQGHGRELRVGFLAIKGLSQAHADQLVAEREQHGPFRTLGDLQQRTMLTREELEALIVVGACDGLGENRSQLHWALALNQPTRRSDEPELPLLDTPTLPLVVGPTADERLGDEFAQMELSPSAHPLMLYREALSQLAVPGVVAAVDLVKHAGKKVSVYGWLVTWRRAQVHKTGAMMKFMTLEDLTGTFEVTLFPEAYQKHGHKLHGLGPYLIEGVVENDRGGLTITAERVERLEAQDPAHLVR